jgi:ubiquinol-cytochrome c reductase subunit 8
LRLTYPGRSLTSPPIHISNTKVIFNASLTFHPSPPIRPPCDSRTINRQNACISPSPNPSFSSAEIRQRTGPEEWNVCSIARDLAASSDVIFQLHGFMGKLGYVASPLVSCSPSRSSSIRSYPFRVVRAIYRLFSHPPPHQTRTWTNRSKETITHIYGDLVFSFPLPYFLTFSPNTGSQPQKGIVSYALSPNRQRPLAGTLHNAIFNTARRTKDQLIYWLPATVLGYVIVRWAIDRYGSCSLLPPSRTQMTRVHILPDLLTDLTRSFLIRHFIGTNI